MDMNKETIEGVVNGMNEVLLPCRSIMSELYSIEMDQMFLNQSPPRGERKKWVSRLKERLPQAAERMAAYLELSGMNETRSEFLASWKGFESNLDKTQWDHSDESDDLSSPALDFLERWYWTFRDMLPESSKQSKGQAEHLELEKCFAYMLRSTAIILGNYCVTPTCEADVKRTMTKHLETVFADYTPQFSIAKPLVSFKPDGGVVSLRSAVEFKFCETEADVKTAIHGITEDLAGYSGSLDWTKFYTVVYQTKPFTNEPKFQAALSGSGMTDRWTFIVVTGQ
jgi:hypothetical protein